MVFSYYILKYPYKLAWHVMRLVKKNPELVAYCADPLDYDIMEPVLKYLPKMQFVVKNKKTADYLKSKGIPCKRMPCFPKAVIMTRHAAYKFPEDKILKFGMRHGAYHFKKFTKARNYNDFEVYMLTSRTEVAIAEQHGIRTAVAVGFPKLDPLFDGSFSADFLNSIREKADINPSKKTIIFSTTWDKSGMSAIEQWIDYLPNLIKDYNILVTVHPWTSSKYINKLRHMEHIYFIDNENLLPFLAVADLMVSDCSSIIAEFCALDKPIITFKVARTKRTVEEIIELLQEISVQIDDVSQLREAISRSLKNPAEKHAQRQRANQLMFDELDGLAGKRAAEVIKKRLAAQR